MISYSHNEKNKGQALFYTKGTITYILPKTYSYITKEFGKETWAS